jgi:hypothetical protein
MRLRNCCTPTAVISNSAATWSSNPIWTACKCRSWPSVERAATHLLNATFKDKSILEHLWQIHLERDYPTWLGSLRILERAIPSADRPKLASFIYASAESKGFAEEIDCLALSAWIPHKQLDSSLADWLEGNTTHAAINLQRDRSIEWTSLRLTWQILKMGVQALRSACC